MIGWARHEDMGSCFSGSSCFVGSGSKPSASANEINTTDLENEYRDQMVGNSGLTFYMLACMQAELVYFYQTFYYRN